MNHMKLSLKSVVTATLLLVTAAASAQETISLAFGYQKGVVYHYRSSDTFDSQQESGSSEMKIGGGTRSLVRMEVTDVSADGSLTCITAFEEMKTVVKSSVLDTLIAQDDLIGKWDQFVVDRNGREVGRKSTEQGSNAGARGLMNVAASRNTPFFQLPGRSVVMGGKWSADINDSSSFGEGYLVQKGTIEFFLAGREKKNDHDCLKITFTSRVNHAGKVRLMDTEVFVEGTGDTSGFIWFDPLAGILVQRESNAIQEMTFAITGMGAMTVPMTQEVKSVYGLVE
jgi:hypothetical protein